MVAFLRQNPAILFSIMAVKSRSIMMKTHGILHALQKRFGKNSVLKGLNLKEGATTIERNGTIGGHKA